MSTPTLYKKQDLNTVQNRSYEQVSATEATQITNSINKFFELFAAKHS